MLDDILQAVIEKRTWEVVNECEQSIKGKIEEFESAVERIKENLPKEGHPDVDLLLDLYFEKHTVSVRGAYTAGVRDKLKLRKEIIDFTN
ncbi:hypothetical protein M3223_08920 [Paenibacillus pasadenensis]|uniref:hypothetical protein n=1 Tax=Paenibacillus pasadenensis TaxID=217090 RepID=UPI00203C6E7E|nr:hypothetical protein [Paenibacillus pasadenensis]MCM3747475.1 hypothetical protein [Paenibacillus pasadenensis]